MPEPSGNASSFAKEMMMKAMEESRTHAAEAPAETDKEGFDYSGMFRELGLKGGGVLVGILVLGIGMYFVVDYMMGGGIRLPKLAYVSGTVTLDGQPLPDATVYFEPKTRQSRSPAQRSVPGLRWARQMKKVTTRCTTSTRRRAWQLRNVECGSVACRPQGRPHSR